MTKRRNEVDEAADLRQLSEALREAKMEILEAESQVYYLTQCLEKIRSTNGLQYSGIFQICDEALKEVRDGK